jgi:ribosome-binding protein aMBF1 (putative translation factor)
VGVRHPPRDAISLAGAAVVSHRYTQRIQFFTVAAMGERRTNPDPPTDVRVRFGDAVRRLREDRGLNQEELAHRAGIHRTYLSDVERGRRNVALVNIEGLARGLGVKLAELFAGVDA